MFIGVLSEVIGIFFLGFARYISILYTSESLFVFLGNALVTAVFILLSLFWILITTASLFWLGSILPKNPPIGTFNFILVSMICTVDAVDDFIFETGIFISLVFCLNVPISTVVSLVPTV